MVVLLPGRYDVLEQRAQQLGLDVVLLEVVVQFVCGAVLPHNLPTLIEALHYIICMALRAL